MGVDNLEVNNMSKSTIEEIIQLFADCEDYQQSGDSEYAKEQSKIAVYNAVAELLKNDGVIACDHLILNAGMVEIQCEEG